MVAAREMDAAELLESNEVMRFDSPGVIESITRGEVDMQVSTAKRFPRSLKTFKQRALTMATLDQRTAESCFYVLPRAGKTIEGPSVRLAEIVASEWGNMRAEYRVVGEDDKFVTAQATCWDMERNVLVRCEVRRRITNKHGKRYDDDMVGVTGNAAGKIAFRNAVFSVVPRAFVDDIYRAARTVAVGDARTLVQQRTECLAYFGKLGVGEARVLALLEKNGIDDVDLDDLAKLRGLATAIKDGEASIDETFPPEPLKEGTHGFGFKKGAAKHDEPPHDAETGEVKQSKPRAKVEPRNEAEAKWLAEQAEKAKRAMTDEEPPHPSTAREPGSDG